MAKARILAGGNRTPNITCQFGTIGTHCFAPAQHEIIYTAKQKSKFLIDQQGKRAEKDG